MKDLGGKPVILRTYEAAVNTKLFDTVYVVTDSTVIYDAIVSAGGQAIMSVKEHSCGSDRIAEAVADLDIDIVVNVQGDEPLIPPQNIEKVVEPLIKDTSVSVTSLRILIQNPKDIFNNNITKVVVDKFDSALYFSKAPIPWDRDTWPVNMDEALNLSAPLWFKHIGLYAYRKKFLMEYSALPVSPLEKVEKLEQLRILENGFSIKVVETKLDSTGVDSESDIEIIEKQLALFPDN